MDRDWSNLPAHLLDSISERLESVLDFLRFGAVCVSWYSVAKDNRIQRAKMMSSFYHPPMLLISADEDNTWNVYNVMYQKVLDLQVSLPNRRFCGSSKGWLIIAEEDFSVTLMNPFYKENAVIRLPQLLPPSTENGGINWDKRKEYYVTRATISADPIVHPDNSIVMVISEGPWPQSLAFTRVGKDTTWSYITGFCCTDVAHFEGFNEGFCGLVPEFLFLEGFNGLLCGFDAEDYINGGSYIQSLEHLGQDYVAQRYLVDTIGGEVLMVVRRYSCTPLGIRETRCFEVFVYDLDYCEWFLKSSIGEAAIFVGQNTALYVLASKFSGCEPNCIYFQGDYYDPGTYKLSGEEALGDYGVYNLENESISREPYTTEAQIELVEQDQAVSVVGCAIFSAVKRFFFLSSLLVLPCSSSHFELVW